MRSNRILFLAMFTFLSLSLMTFSGCGSSDQDPPEQRARFTKMIDERRYTDVINLIENNPNTSSGSSQDSHNYQDLLAMANLGRSGFEPLSFATQVLAQQSPANELDELVPNCDPSEIDSNLAQIPIRCLIKRLWQHLPLPDAPDFLKARMILRAQFPDPQTTEKKYNTLIGVVEAASAISRMGQLALIYQTKADAVQSLVQSQNTATVVDIASEVASQFNSDEVATLLDQIVQTSNEALRSIARLPYASNTVEKLLLGLEKRSLFASDGQGLTWMQETEIPVLINFTDQLNQKLQSDINSTPPTQSSPIPPIAQLVQDLKN